MFDPKSLIDNRSLLIQVMAWCLTGDKPLPEPIMTNVTPAYMSRYVKHTAAYISALLKKSIYTI